MNKADIKAICEQDSQLQWWAMVLFAEIYDMYQGVHNGSGGAMQPIDHKIIAQYVRAKCDEFPRRVIRRQVERANEASNPNNPTPPPPFYPPPERKPEQPNGPT